MINFMCFRRSCTFLSLFIALLLVISGGSSLSAQGAKDIRTAVIKIVSKNWPAYNSQYIEYRMNFPMNGGAISGTGKETYHFLVPVEFDSNAQATKHEKRQQTYTYRLEGTFSGGDGGAVNGRIIPEDKVTEHNQGGPFSGKLWANGKGVITVGDSKFDVTFTPFGECCNKDLNSYSDKIQEMLELELLRIATPYLHKKLVTIMETSMRLGYKMTERAAKAGKTMYSAARVKFNKFAAGRVSLPPMKLDPAFAKKVEDAFNVALKQRNSGLVSSLIDGIVTNMDKCYELLKVAEAASSGAYAEASYTAAAAAVGAYSNLAGLVVAFGEAAKADWDGFCETNYESEFRRFYKRIYFEDSSLPSEKIGRAGAQGRLKEFMDECMEWLSAGGGHGAQLRKMLMDFAYYKLGLSKNRSDFEVVEKKGKLVMATREDATVLAALFQAYEQVFLMDLEAERARKLSVKRYLEDKRQINSIMVALDKAERGNFSEVWPKAEYNKIFCEMYHRLEKEGKLKEAGK
ncbi:MAG: hypothetical protein GQF41_0724 [Candidatus Rifleibacterium amylolyticum]|nr:MAG: hypothetical protein GQF41_0724 [Candidatus Rifleibacterium amylolyticum]